jgi:prolyl-tRNA synthetase
MQNLCQNIQYEYLTTRAEDYSKWYNELVVKADLAENSGVRGCMVIKPTDMLFGKNAGELIECLKRLGIKLLSVICS